MAVDGRRRCLVTALFTLAASSPGVSWAGGWYWVWPPPGAAPMHVTRDWTVIQPFETLGACEEARGREYGKALEDARRVGAGLDQAQRAMLKFILESDVFTPAERQSTLREAQKDPRLNDALIALVVGTTIHNSICLASDDPRVRNSPILSLPPLPPAGQTPGAGGGATIRYTPGRPIFVTVLLNGRASARLILDTGADRSVIKPRSLIAAGVDLARPSARGELRGIAGAAEALYFTLDSIEVGEARVQHLGIAAYDIGANDSDGLLGRDFLDRFNVSIDPASGIARLRPK
jgi:aspartyl protease